MGGCSSKFAAQEQRRRSTIYGRRNTLIIRPKVNINVGACINKETWHSHKGRKIIFIFGMFCLIDSNIVSLFLVFLAFAVFIQLKNYSYLLNLPFTWMKSTNLTS